jgi:flagellar biosynthetic protein FliS
MRGYNRYRSNKVQNAPKQQLVTMLFQEAIKRLGRCKVIEGERFTAAQIKDLGHVREIYTELLLALDPEAAPELVQRLAPLYRWCLQALTEAVSEQSTELVDQVQNITDTILEGWTAALEQPTRQSA